MVRIEKAKVRKKDMPPAFKNKRFVYDLMQGNKLLMRTYSKKEADFYLKQIKKNRR